MSGSHIAFRDLKVGRHVNRVVGRLLRFWEARNVKKAGELMGVDLLLVDEKSTLMQGSIHVLHLPKFQPSLVEGAVYVISGFEVARSNIRFKVTDFDKSIRFNQGTSMDVIEESLCVIPKELFRFRSYEELVSLSNTNKELPDVMGQVCSSKAYHNEATQKMERMSVQLRLESGENVRVSAFDHQAITLNRRLEKKEGGTCVLLATNINPKFFGGELYLNATCGTHFYFDPEVEATREFAEKQGNKETGDNFRGVQKIEQVTIAELNEIVLGPITEDAEFLCIAKVVEIQGDKGWNFISCSRCGKKMVKEESTLSCEICHHPGAVGNVRYRVEMVVNDGVTDAVFVAFDQDMLKLTNTAAGTLAAQLAEADDVAEDHFAVPEPISKLVGNTYTFHIKLTAFNFTPHHRSFTVRRIYVNPNTAPRPSFAEEEQLLEIPTAETSKETVTTSSTSTSTILPASPLRPPAAANKKSLAKKPKLN